MGRHTCHVTLRAAVGNACSSLEYSVPKTVNVCSVFVYRLFRTWMQSISVRIWGAACQNALLKSVWNSQLIQSNTLHTGSTNTLITSMQRSRLLCHNCLSSTVLLQAIFSCSRLVHKPSICIVKLLIVLNLTMQEPYIHCISECW